jgi:hypothetical protein
MYNTSQIKNKILINQKILFVIYEKILVEPLGFTEFPARKMRVKNYKKPIIKHVFDRVRKAKGYRWIVQLVNGERAYFPESRVKKLVTIQTTYDVISEHFHAVGGMNNGRKCIYFTRKRIFQGFPTMVDSEMVLLFYYENAPVKSEINAALEPFRLIPQ